MVKQVYINKTNAFVSNSLYDIKKDNLFFITNIWKFDKYETFAWHDHWFLLAIKSNIYSKYTL